MRCRDHREKDERKDVLKERVSRGVDVSKMPVFSSLVLNIYKCFTFNEMFKKAEK